MAHASKSGVSTFVGEDEEAVLEEVRYLLSFLPSNNLEVPPHVAPADDPMRETPELRELMPASPNIPYDMKTVIAATVDDGDYVEYFSHWAGPITCGIARLAGPPAGLSGNRPRVLAGGPHVTSSEKRTEERRVGEEGGRKR